MHPFITRKKHEYLVKESVHPPVCGRLIDDLEHRVLSGRWEKRFYRGQQLYAEARFTAARAAFEQAVQCQPAVSEYHHWLGRTYGRLAGHAGWFEAMRLAKQTREALERAVKLDPNNVEALSDLREYYLRAPTFLGGGQVKADRIRQQLEDVLSDSARKP
jgi:tetratricopeptide (TPR) repeat protein